jgi:hypothetical protein
MIVSKDGVDGVGTSYSSFVPSKGIDRSDVFTGGCGERANQLRANQRIQCWRLA